MQELQNTNQNTNPAVAGPKLLTVRQACEAGAFSRTTLYQLIRVGRIRTVKVGLRGIRIPVAELERFIQEGLNESAFSGQAL